MDTFPFFGGTPNAFKGYLMSTHYVPDTPQGTRQR